MADIIEIRARLDFWKQALTKLRAAYLALVDGGAKSYTIDKRELTKLDLPQLRENIKEAEREVDSLTAELCRKRPRKAVGIIPRDW